jgi:AraC-like DNA-binding protein
MIVTVATYLNYFLILLSLIVLVEVLVVFKRPFILKIHLVLLIIFIVLSTLGYLIIPDPKYSLFYFDGAKPIMGIVTLNFFLILCDHSLKRKVILFELLLLIVTYSLFFIRLRVISTSNSLQYGVFNTQFQFIASFFRVLFTVFLVFTVYRILKKYNDENIYFRKIKNWAFFFMACIPLAWAANLFKLSLLVINYERQIFLFIAFLLVNIFILYRPKFLNNFTLDITLGNTFNKNNVLEITNEDFDKIFYEGYYYLNKDASMEHLAKQLNIPFETFHTFFYTNFDNSFVEIVNKARVAYFLKIIKDEKYKGFTVDAIAQEAGFSSRHHLYPPFKKYHGGTPSEYMKKNG